MSYTSKEQRVSLSFGKKRDIQVPNQLAMKSMGKGRQEKPKSQRASPSPFQKQSWSFQEIFTLINQQSRLFPTQVQSGKQNNDQGNLQTYTPSQVIEQIAKRLIMEKEKCQELRKEIVIRDQSIASVNQQVAELKKVNRQLMRTVDQLNGEIAFWREGHQKMLHSMDNPKEQFKEMPSPTKTSTLKQLKQSIREERMNQKTKSKVINSHPKTTSPASTQRRLSQDCQIQTDFVRSIIYDLESISMYSSHDQNPFQDIVIEANNQLREDLRDAGGHISQLMSRIDSLEERIQEQRDIFKIQKQREFSLLKQKFSQFLEDYHRFRIGYSELRTENSALKKTLPTEDQFDLSLLLTPSKH